MQKKNKSKSSFSQGGASHDLVASVQSPSPPVVLNILSFIAEQTRFEDLLAGLPDVLQELVEADYCAMEVFDEAKGRVCQYVLFGLAPEHKQYRKPLNKDRLNNDTSLEPFEEITDTHYSLYLPLTTNNKEIGILYFCATATASFSQREKSDLVIISKFIALMVSNLQQKTTFDSLAENLHSEIVARERDSKTLMSIVEGVGAEIGNSFFRSVAQHLCGALNARYSYIGEITNNGTRVKTIAVWCGDHQIANFDYNIEGATGNACNDKLCYCCDSVKKLLPDKTIQKSMSIESCWALPLNDSEDETIGVLVVMHDGPMEREENIIPVMKIFAARSGPELERIRTEELLYREKEKAQVTLSSIGDGVITTCANGNIEYANPSAEKMLGRKLNEIRGSAIQKVFCIVDGTTKESIIEPIYRKSKDPHTLYNATLLRRDASEIPITYTTSKIKSRNESAIGDVIVFHDVSTFRNLMDQVIYQASHDEMTGLINRRQLEKEIVSLLETCYSEQKTHAIMFIDLDRFKAVNDSCGHAAGDELLRQISVIMRESVRDNDFVARIGGDEFAILLQCCPLNVASDVAEQIRRKIKNHHYVRNGIKFPIGASIGLIPLTQQSGDLSTVFNAADAACHVAKELGRDNVYISSHDDTAIQKYKGEVQWSYRIHEAAEKDLFCLFSQPIKPLSCESATSQYYEVLLRMNDDNGPILPMAFIPIAERFKLMAKIDNWVIKKTFEHLHNQHTQNSAPVTHCGINLSGQSLGDREVLGTILTLKDEMNVNPENICFEITETAAVENISIAAEFIKRLRDIGFKFALDDFGTGLSSFSYLRNLPVDYLKIDGEFIKDMTKNDTDRIMVDSINRIGKSMGMKIIAEFVDNKATVELLKEIGVDFAQGYYIGKPTPLK